jgi:hypothetical protein
MAPDVVRAVAERTRVDRVVVGSYVRSGDAIRINVRLQDARTVEARHHARNPGRRAARHRGLSPLHRVPPVPSAAAASA